MKTAAPDTGDGHDCRWVAANTLPPAGPTPAGTPRYEPSHLRRTRGHHGPAKNLPVAVIGAGPVGLAAAAHLIERGIEPLIFEAGPTSGAAIEQWRHIRLFSPWRYNIDAAAVRLLEATGWERTAPTALPYRRGAHRRVPGPRWPHFPPSASRLHTGARVIAVTRLGMDKTHSGTATPPLRGPGRARRRRSPDHQVRPSSTPPAPGPPATRSEPRACPPSAKPPPRPTGSPHRCRTSLGRDREPFAGHHVLVVGAGHSAANTLITLAELAPRTNRAPGSSGPSAAPTPPLYGGGDLDGLPARGQLGSPAAPASSRTGPSNCTPASASPPSQRPTAAVTVTPRTAAPWRWTSSFPATGFRPDLDILRELRLDLDPAVEAPA